MIAKYRANCALTSRAPRADRGRGASLAWTCAPFALALLALPAAAQPTLEQVGALDAKIAETPAQSIDLIAAARAGANGQLPLPPAVPGSVVPGASAFKPGEARFVALFAHDEQTVAEFVRAERQLNMPSARLFRGVFRVLGADEQPVTLKAVAFTGEPLRFQAQHDQFEGRISVGLVAVGENGAKKLATPVPFQLLGPVSGTPATLLVDHVGPPYDQVVVATRALACPLDVQVVSAAVPEGVSLSVAGEPAIRMLARPAAIQGLGLQSADLTFELVGPRPATLHSVQLGASLGTLGATSFRMGAGHARTLLRSQRLGTASVTATAPGVAPVKLQVEFLFPWALLLAALVGGLSGGLLHYRLDITRYQALATGVLGVLTAALYVWSMEQAPIELPPPVGEILMLALSTLAVYYVAKLYARMARR